MPRFVAGLALLLALALVPAAPVLAFDAQTVFAKAKGSVVVVTSLDGLRSPKKYGTGFLVGDGSQVVTNFHVVDGASEVTIKTPDDQVTPVTVVATDKVQDLALLKLNGWGPALDIAEELPEVGQDVAAIGTPKGLEFTLSTGVVSALRQIAGREVVQITAPISQGSSGGPVLDAKGRVVGVATFMAAEGQNLNFAIPCTTVLHFLGWHATPRKPVEQAVPQQPQPGLEIKKRADGSIEIVQPRKGRQ